MKMGRKRLPTLLIFFLLQSNSKFTFFAKDEKIWTIACSSNNDVYLESDWISHSLYADLLAQECFMVKWVFFLFVRKTTEVLGAAVLSSIPHPNYKNLKLILGFHQKLTLRYQILSFIYCSEQIDWLRQPGSTKLKQVFSAAFDIII